MDYIREELLRQRKLWSALLLGRGTAAEEEETRENEVEYAEEVPDAGSGVRAESEEVFKAGGGAGAPRPTERTRRWMQTENGGGVRMVTEVLRVEQREATDAKALSRAVQRDARRYDGGFTLY